MNVELRRATAADVAAVEQLVAEAYGKYVARIGVPPMPMLDDYAKVVAEAEAWVATRDDEVIGLLVLRPGDDALLLENVAVAPPEQGRGVGRLLLEHAETRARDHGCRAVDLYTNEKMTENIALYGRVGYVEVGRTLVNGRRRVSMRKQL